MKLPLSLSHVPSRLKTVTAKPSTEQPRFAAVPQPSPPVVTKKSQMLALPGFLARRDFQTLAGFFQTRDTTQDLYQDWGAPRKEVSHLNCNIQTRDGKITRAAWAKEKGVLWSQKQKAMLLRTIKRFVRMIHQKIEPLKDGRHTILAVPQEYTYKAGDMLPQTLRWHQDSFLRYLGILGVHVDPRILGANLELRALRQRETVQEVQTRPNQMLAFHNINCEHQVNETLVDEANPDQPAYRRVLTLGVKDVSDW